MVDYAVYFKKANGKQALKFFKWLGRGFTHKTIDKIAGKHSFKKSVLENIIQEYIA